MSPFCLMRTNKSQKLKFVPTCIVFWAKEKKEGKDRKLYSRKIALPLMSSSLRREFELGTVHLYVKGHMIILFSFFNFSLCITSQNYYSSL